MESEIFILMSLVNDFLRLTLNIQGPSPAFVTSIGVISFAVKSCKYWNAIGYGLTKDGIKF